MPMSIEEVAGAAAHSSSTIKMRSMSRVAAMVRTGTTSRSSRPTDGYRSRLRSIGHSLDDLLNSQTAQYQEAEEAEEAEASAAYWAAALVQMAVAAASQAVAAAVQVMTASICSAAQSAVTMRSEAKAATGSFFSSMSVSKSRPSVSHANLIFPNAAIPQVSRASSHGRSQNCSRARLASLWSPPTSAADKL